MSGRCRSARPSLHQAHPGVGGDRALSHSPEPGTPQADRFDVLAALLRAYEADVHPVPDVSPVEVIRFIMEQSGYTQSELAIVLGSRSRASEVLRGRRNLTVEMIAALNRAWSIPAGALLPNRAAA